MRFRRVFDPLYGPTWLTEREWHIASSPEVQRLRYVRMCNINSLLVMGASQPNRFEHSLGVLRLAQEWVGADARRAGLAGIVSAAALLHDFQTGPFGHSLQYVLEDNAGHPFLHDDIVHGGARSFYQPISALASYGGKPFTLREYLGDDWEAVGEAIRGEGPVGPLIASRLDIDNIDNVFRLAYHAGLVEYGDVDVPVALVKDLFLDNGKLGISSASIPRVERWMAVRKRLYEVLLYDWAEFSAKAMLTSAIERATAARIIESEAWLLTDDELVKTLELSSVGRHQDIRELARRVRVGELYVPLLLVRSSSVERYKKLATADEKRRLERALVKRLAGAAEGRYLIHFILDQGKTERILDISIDGVSRSVGRNSSSLLVGVFASRTPEPKHLPKIESECMALLASVGVKSIQRLPDPAELIDASASDASPQLGLFDEP